ncbi:MAG: class I SAM-dependent DNA methyltransferase [Gaiellaceae bacterium]
MASSSSSHRFWDRIAERYDERTSEELDAYHELRLEHMRGFLQPEDSVLDFACGPGRAALDLAPYVGNVLGIDLSTRMIERADAKLTDGEPTNVRFAAIDLFNPELDNRRFSVVTAFNILHLLDDPSRYLQRLSELLAPDGLLIAETPCLAHKRWYVRVAIRLIGSTRWLPRAQIWAAEDVERLVAGQGFEIVEAMLLDHEIGDPWLVARTRAAR